MWDKEALLTAQAYACVLISQSHFSSGIYSKVSMYRPAASLSQGLIDYLKHLDVCRQ